MLLGGSGENRFRQAKADMPIVGIERTPAHVAAPLSHGAILSTRRARYVPDEAVNTGESRSLADRPKCLATSPVGPRAVQERNAAVPRATSGSGGLLAAR